MSRKFFTLVALVAALAPALAGCTAAPPSVPASVPPSGASRTYTDDLGRQVRLPATIERVAPSGPMAQLVLFALCPDKLVGLASMFSGDQFSYIDQKYAALPVFGSLYGAGLNLEAVMAARPQVIVDIGDATSAAAGNLDSVQAKTGVPTVFVAATMDTLAATYRKLGALTGDAVQAAQLADYVDATLSDVTSKVATIPAAARPSVYYGLNNGLTGVAGGSTHSGVIDAVGARNVVPAGGAGGAGTVPVSMEQLMLWNPDVILFAPHTVHDVVAGDPRWQGLSAIKAGRDFEIPGGPYSWIDQPPSVNQIIGVVWLANLLYPDVFRFDMVSQTRQFYQLFYHCDLTDARARALLANSTYQR